LQPLFAADISLVRASALHHLEDSPRRAGGPQDHWGEQES